MCFQSGLVPSEWQRGIIAPIPKCDSDDPRVPLNYRGITLASSVYKLYCSILNSRLSAWAESNDLLSDCQNGFRKDRSTLDSLSTVTTLTETRQKLRLSTYAAFVDFSKAYDRVNRQLLWNKMHAFGVRGTMMLAIQSIYKDVKCCVRVNGANTDWFDVNTGLKQGCLLSPLLFNIFINDLSTELSRLEKGVRFGGERLSVVFYADDLVILAENEENLQLMLDALHEWCDRWCMRVNAQKTKVVHFVPHRFRGQLLFSGVDRKRLRQWRNTST